MRRRNRSNDQAVGGRCCARVRRDEELAPLFAAASAKDGWPVHVHRMHGVWSSVMLSGRYNGDPVSVHGGVSGVTPLFGSWLDLFEATAAELFIPEIAEQFAVKASRIAESLKLARFFRIARPCA